MNRKKIIFLFVLALLFLTTTAYAINFNGLNISGVKTIGSFMILGLGDSITLGLDDVDVLGYRPFLYSTLKNSHIIKFVGSQNFGEKENDDGTRYDHAGVNGETTSQIEERTLTELQERMKYPYSSSMVLLHAGTNDMSTNLTGTAISMGTAVTGDGTLFNSQVTVGDYVGSTAKGFREVTAINGAFSLTIASPFSSEFNGTALKLLTEDISGSVQNIVDIVNIIKNFNSNIAVYVALITPINESVADSKVTEFNTALNSLLQTEAIAGVYIVDMNAAFKNTNNCSTYSSCLFDIIHPNPAGYAVMADAWATAILANE